MKTAYPTIPMQSVESSQIAELGYDAATKTLAMRFTSKKGPGSLYHYQNVEQQMFDELRGAESIGRFFGEHIKPFKEKFPYAKINEEQAAEEQPS